MTKITTLKAIKTAVFENNVHRFRYLPLVTLDKQNMKLLFPNTAYRLNTHHFRIGSQVYSSIYFGYHFDNTTNTSSYTGIYYDVIEEMSRYLNMSYTIHIPEDGFWGHLDANNTWTGLVGQLVRREVDFVIAPLTVSSIRRRAIDFADKPLEVTYISGIYRKPSYTVNAIHLIVSPFEYGFWISVLLSIFLYSFMLFVSEWYNSQTFYYSFPNYLKRIVLLYFRKFYYSFCSLLQQPMFIQSM